MAIGVSYEESERVFGPGEDYSALLAEKCDSAAVRIARMHILFERYVLFSEYGFYALTIPTVNPVLRQGRRYLLSAAAPEPERPWMAHAIVVDESGKVFDPDPQYDPSNPKYSIENYKDLLGWEIVSWRGN
jgi:hypothetical protein